MLEDIKVCQWGAFDVANYGDRLFPLIAREQLTARLPGLALTCYAPVGHAKLPPGSPPLFPLVPGGGPLHQQRREYFARHFDAIIIGGGDLLRFDQTEPGYDSSEHERPLRPYDAFLDPLWEEDGIQPNILWNAPGVTFPFEPSRRLLVQRACSFVRYAAVRDEISRDYLLEAGVEGPIHVFPDSGILLAELVRQRVDEEKVGRLLRRRGVEPDDRGLLCFQCAPGFLRKEEVSVAKSLARIADSRNLEVVLLPIGLCHGDLDALRLAQRAGGNRFTLVEDVESPLEIGAVIGACDYFVGSSLHGNLSALSFGIPHIIINNPLRSAKLEGLVQLAHLEEFRITDWEDLESSFDRLVATPRERWTKTGDHLKARASAHFDRLAEEISRSAEERRGPAGTPPPTTSRQERPAPAGEIPLEVYSTIAWLHERLDEERAAWQSAREELTSANRQLLERYQARVRHHEDKNRSLEARLQSLRAENEGLKSLVRSMERSRAWRLFAPYRRLRARLGALIKPSSRSEEDREPRAEDAD
jgi:polysaccharide pyruvyl transferase WcaK-like protein